MTNSLRFDDKVVIVTGAGNGLGRAHALMFGARGARVVVNDLGGGAHGDGKSSAAADKVVEEIKALGGQAVANYDSVTDGERIVQQALDAFGRIDVLINNAGILRDVSFAKMSEQDWELIYRVHVYGSFKLTHAAWPHLRAQNYGRIIMTASAAGIYGNFGQANYSMAKMGLIGLGQTLALEGRKNNVHVNIIAPVAGSRLTETILPKEVVDALKPEYVSPLVAWLCHEECKETGALFEVGAGYHGKLRWERAEGHMFAAGRAFTPEDVAAKWEVITDFTKTTHPRSAAESMAPVLENLSRKSRGGNQFIDLDAAAADEINTESAYDERDLALYALGVGAARNALDASELKFTYELGEHFQALPTYAVMPSSNAFLTLGREGKGLKGLNYGLDRVLHGEQYTELFRPLPPTARLKHRIRFKDAYDKDKNAIVVLTVDTSDESGQKLAYNEVSVFVRGAGGWGGDRGPSGDINVPPAREPDAVIEEKTDANQTLLYRLSGDWNPLHADPAFAKAFGFDKPILHGLCTFGHVGRHVIKAFCDNDGRRFKSIKVRFADSVFPGETLVTRMWKESATRIVVETRVKERDKLVIKNAAVELYEQIPQVQAKAAPAVAASAAPATDMPTSADIFAAIGQHLATQKGMGDQLKTMFQFQLKDPASSWALDLKSGDGSLKSGVADNPDVTLELSEENFVAMSTGKADANKLYFGGKLKVTGNVMASQKLGFLQKLDPRLVMEAMKARTAGAAGAAPVAAAPAAAFEAVKPGRAAQIFKALAERLATDPTAGKGIGQVLQFKLSQPESSYVVDFTLSPAKVVSGIKGHKPATVLTLADADLAALASGKATAQSLFQRGRLRVDGDVQLAHKLGFLDQLI